MAQPGRTRIHRRITLALLALLLLAVFACGLVTLESYQQVCVLAHPSFAACEKFPIVVPLHVVVAMVCFGPGLIPWVFPARTITGHAVQASAGISAIGFAVYAINEWVSMPEQGTTEAWPFRLALFAASIAASGILISFALRWSEKLKETDAPRV